MAAVTSNPSQNVSINQEHKKVTRPVRLKNLFEGGVKEYQLTTAQDFYRAENHKSPFENRAEERLKKIAATWCNVKKDTIKVDRLNSGKVCNSSFKAEIPLSFDTVESFQKVARGLGLEGLHNLTLMEQIPDETGPVNNDWCPIDRTLTLVCSVEPSGIQIGLSYEGNLTQEFGRKFFSLVFSSKV